ncbi:PREDICTED: taste receptor type 2 member 40-like [Nanorana parkeri]|uniref:taste receptor type 2 member 40-like n=1 Tax=Nanorana parkeri TaxID=125878 RepID=UPI000854CD5E|nr:PREDICTED: taste receptor type 2 member 40-like [Nanorana parkeri]
MEFSLHKLLLMVMLAECFVGVAFHIFIVSFQFLRWKTLKSQKTYNKILTCLAISRSFLLLHVSLFYILYLFFPWVLGSIILRSAFLVEVMLLNNTNLWITTFLFAFYCVKITTYNHTIFIYMKTRISRLVPHFILGCFLVSLVSSLPFGWCVFYLPQQISANMTVNFSNMTMNNLFYKENAHNMLMLFIVGSFPPFVISCGAIYLLIRSLWHHAREMISTEKGFQGPNIEAHINAVKIMSVFLFGHVLYFVCMSMLFSDVIHESNPWKMINAIVVFALPSLHSAFIVSSNVELKQSLTEMWHGLIRCF